MSYLAPDLRSLLERTVVEARDVAELGAKAALEALGVGDGKVPTHLEPGERELRVRLRARARQLGDSLDAKSQVQATKHLVREIAYEHWHRMLFARFLAESHLLVEPESGVSVSLDEVRELARASDEDPWAVAGRFAERMLPAIFRSNDPVLALTLPPERLNRLESLLEELPAEVFRADDALGWVYQFWQAEEKARIDREVKSGLRIGADELPAVTQLFTEPYMVQFLLHNTLGAWYAGKVFKSNSGLATSATSEEELRRACGVPGYEWTYLRFARDRVETGVWRPAAGTFPGWPASVAQVTFLDPCCGSGHFLVEAFSALVALRQHEEGLDPIAAVRSVLAENLNGLELDPRCTQLAAFAVAFRAWRTLGKVVPLPQVRIACSGLATGVPKAEWLGLVGNDPELRRGMERLHDLFQKAPTLGSLLDPRAEVSQDLFTASLERLEGFLLEAAGMEATATDAAAAEIAVVAAGMALATEKLLARYTLIATNVPYLTKNKQSRELQRHCETFFREARYELATTFLRRCLDLTTRDGTVAVVTPENWHFLASYEELRRSILMETEISVVATLGPAAFRDMNWWAARTALTVISSRRPSEAHCFAGFDASATRELESKVALLVEGPAFLLKQEDQASKPEARITLAEVSKAPQLATVAKALQGISTADSDRFVRFFWERPSIAGLATLQGSVRETVEFGGRESVLDLSALEREASDLGAAIRGRAAWERRGVAVRQMRHLPATIHEGGAFDTNVSVLVPAREETLAAVWCFVSDHSFHEEVRKLDKKTNVTNATLAKVPFDLARWEKVARERYSNGLPEPQSDDPTQWIYHGQPSRSMEPLQAALARLLGYQWPAALEQELRLSAEARGLVESSRELLGLADKDGVVCLSSLRSEEPAAVRLRTLLAEAFGDEWSAAKERELLEATPGKATSLEEWLRDRFFEEHCSLFHQRPFIWHIWDGSKDGFHAFVNYHRLAEGNGKGRQLLESLTYAYLGEWIDRQRRGAASGETGAETRLAAALELQGELKKILEGEAPYDIFVRWKPLHRQAIGWEPDIDDGVRLNARPFMMAKLSGGKKGAGLFRSKPNIHWRKDRGAEPRREPEDYPWFRKDGKSKGERHNDLHLTLAEKRRAREAKAKHEGKK